VLDRLPPGEVASYGEVAMQAGYPGAARAVGTYLRDRGGAHPWWRVVANDGTLRAGHAAEQAELLAAEGLLIRDGRVVAQRRPASRVRR